MQFNSYYFILYFLPLIVLLYFLANRIKPALGKLVLIVASVLFYSLGRVQMLVFLAISMAINYGSAKVIRKRLHNKRLFMILPIVVNVGLLLYCKYTNFVITNINVIFGSEVPLKNIILPLGISFYTFQQIAYLVATENGELKDNSLIDYLTYILYFPKLVMGPLADPVVFITQLDEGDRKRLDLDKLASGIKLFSFGLIKKVLIADTFADAASWVYSHLADSTPVDCILLVVFYTLEIYFDFSGYSDMALGVSSMLGIDLPINFDSPYKAISIRNFWKRWHISLTKFLTKYIYIPLGGSRKGKVFTYVNTLIVFLISGLWHGANWTFVLWGLLHGLLSCFDRFFERFEEKIWKPIRWLFTMIAVSLLWLLFSAKSVGQWLMVLGKIVSIRSLSISDKLIDQFNLPERNFFYDVFHIGNMANGIKGFNMLVFLLVAGLICLIPENNYRNKDKLSVASMLLAAVSFVWGVLCLGSESTFVYFGF